MRDERQRLGLLVQAGGENVRASFNLSYGQLAEATQGVFATLGELPDEFGLLVAGVVTEFAAADADVRAELEALIAAQLVERMGEGRYRYHDLMRIFAKERLGEKASLATEEKAFEVVSPDSKLF